MAPLLGLNQALLVDELGTDIDDLIYDVTGLYDVGISKETL